MMEKVRRDVDQLRQERAKSSDATLQREIESKKKILKNLEERLKVTKVTQVNAIETFSRSYSFCNKFFTHRKCQLPHSSLFVKKYLRLHQDMIWSLHTRLRGWIITVLTLCDFPSWLFYIHFLLNLKFIQSATLDLLIYSSSQCMLPPPLPARNRPQCERTQDNEDNTEAPPPLPPPRQSMPLPPPPVLDKRGFQQSPLIFQKNENVRIIFWGFPQYYSQNKK